MDVNIRKKVNATDKKHDVESEDFEYDLENDLGETFHVTVHREVVKEAAEIEK